MRKYEVEGFPVSFELGVGGGWWALWIIVSATKFLLFGLDNFLCVTQSDMSKHEILCVSWEN